TIYRDMTFDFKLEELKFTNEDSQEKYELFKELEFNSLLNNMAATEVEEIASFTAERTDSLNDFSDDISIYLEVHDENYLKAKPEFIGIADKDFVLVKEASEFDADELSQFLNTRTSVTTYDLKRQVALLNHLNVEFDNFTEDIMLGSFLLNPSKKIIDVAETAADFNVSINSDDFHYGKGRKQKDPSAEETKAFVADKVQAIEKVTEPMAEKLRADEMYDLWH